MRKYELNLQNKRCTICSSSGKVKISNKMKYGPQLSTVICTNCSLVYTNPIPPEATYNSFYLDDYEKYYGKVTATRPLFNEIPLSHLYKIENLDKIITLKDSTYFEVGPGRGDFLFWANKYFLSTHSIEPSNQFVSELHNCGLSCEQGTLETYSESLSKKKYDVIGMFHVLEHFYNPKKALGHCWDLLNEDGLIMIEVPNILKPYRSFDKYFLRFVHLHNFSPDTLKNILLSNGFEIVYLDEGGDNWKYPQNIFALAKKTKLINHADNFNGTDYTKCLNAIKNYRLKYFMILKIRWSMLKLKRSLKSILITIKDVFSQ